MTVPYHAVGGLYLSLLSYAHADVKQLVAIAAALK
jgi:hypothetical protein